MTDEKLDQILALTVERSKNHELDWKVFDDEGLTFATELATATIVVDSLDQDGAPPYRLIVLRPGERGEWLASLEQGAHRDPGGPAYDRPELELLYALARSKALKVEPVLDSLLEELRTGEASTFRHGE
jgi:hypothetical protein